MPELPEVEVIRRGLAPHLSGKRITGLACGAHRLREQGEPAELRRACGQVIGGLTRRGKYLLVHLEWGHTLLIHLGMSGRLLLFPEPAPELPHGHIVMHLEGGLALVFQDVRRFGQFLLFPPGVIPPPLMQLGPEPFDRRLTAVRLRETARGRSRPIKNFLLDGRLIAGIGNIYACEALFAARLHPATPAGALTPADWTRLLRAVRKVLKAAIRQGGTTINDFVDGHGQTGLFALELQVYGREGEPCRKCRTAIARLVQAGRSSFFCPRCQPLT